MSGPKPTRRRSDPNAGPVIVDERLAAVPVQPSAPRKPVATTRQTLDLPTDDYQRLHDQVRDYARQQGLTSRDFNAQRVLRALVARVLTDDHAELRQQVFNDVRQQVRSS